MTALKTDLEIFAQPPPIFPPNPQWQNFEASTTYIPFWRYMWNTIAISGLTVLGTVLSCTFIAYGFARIRWPGRNIIFLIYLSTIMLPSQVTLIPLYLIFRNLGWVGTFLPLVVPHFFGSAPLCFSAPAVLVDDPARVERCGEDRWRERVEYSVVCHDPADAGRRWRWWRSLLSCRPIATSSGPLIYLTNQQDWTISLGLKLFQNMYGAQWQLMMAASTLAMLPTIVLFFFTQKTFVRGHRADRAEGVGRPCSTSCR